MHGMRGVAGSQSVIVAIAKALSVDRTFLDEAYLHRPHTCAADRRRFVTLQPDGAVPMGLRVLRTQRIDRVMAAEVAGAKTAGLSPARGLASCRMPRR